MTGQRTALVSAVGAGVAGTGAANGGGNDTHRTGLTARSGAAEPVTGGSGRERVERAAYDLFSRRGAKSVGVDTVIAEAGVAKMTLYRNFSSKDELILAFLRRRAQLWTNGWLRTQVYERASTPVRRLITVFELFDEWFHRADFEGCSFITTIIEYPDVDSPVRQAAVAHLAEIRSMLRELAAEAGAADPDALARQWQVLMNGAIVAASAGDVEAAFRSRELGELLLSAHGLID